jgi:hypothetical protein
MMTFVDQLYLIILLFLWSKNSVFHETHSHFHLSCDVLLLDLSLAVFFGVWVFPVDFCSSGVVARFLVRAEPASRFNYQIVCVLSQRWPRPLPVPSVCCFRFCFSLSAPAVRAVGFRSRLRSCSRHSGRPGCSSLVWSVRTLISPFQLLRAQGADYAHSARLFVVVRFFGRWIWLTQDQFFPFS